MIKVGEAKIQRYQELAEQNREMYLEANHIASFVVGALGIFSGIQKDALGIHCINGSTKKAGLLGTAYTVKKKSVMSLNCGLEVCPSSACRYI